MTALFQLLPWLAQLRHRHLRRRTVESTLRRFTSRKKAAGLARFIP